MNVFVRALVWQAPAWDHWRVQTTGGHVRVNASIDYDNLSDALNRCGASWDAAQAHGLLCGRVSVQGRAAGPSALAAVLEGADATDAGRGDCERALNALLETTRDALTERMSAFSPLLPDDQASAATRTEALAHWCEGYLHGLVSGGSGEALKAQLAAEPVSDIIKDMLQITRAGVADDGGSEEDEKAYVEIVEYLRVATQLVYEELAGLRTGDGA